MQQKNFKKELLNILMKKNNLYKVHIGENNPNAKYTNEEISYLCELLENNEDSLNDLLEKCKVELDVIYDVYNGTRWKSISKYFNVKNCYLL